MTHFENNFSVSSVFSVVAFYCPTILIDVSNVLKSEYFAFVVERPGIDLALIRMGPSYSSTIVNGNQSVMPSGRR